MKEKILFVHVCNESQPKIKFISSGFIALANLMQKKGFECTIINTYIEKELNNKFSLADYIKKKDYRIICFSLQWHYQSKSVIDSIIEIKKNLKDAVVIIGGRTASFFADEIMKKFDSIDFIIKGFAEVPFPKLIEKIKHKDADFSDIPNLFWRKKDKIIKNNLIYMITKEILSDLSFNDSCRIENNETYNKIGLSKNDKQNEWLTVYNCGVGCPVDCSYCSGSKSCQEKINGTKEPIMIEHEKVIERLKEVSLKGTGVWYTSFDPFPDSDYYVELFKKIKEEGIKLRCKFESWALPNERFIREFSKVFEAGSEIIISPETGSERVRKLNKGYFYKNKDFIKTLKELEKYKIGFILYFTAGLPFESKSDFIKTLSLVNFIRKRFSDVKIVSVPIEMEPGSPMFIDEKKFKIKKNRNSFMDYYGLENKPDIGYQTDNFRSEEIIEMSNLINIEANCRLARSVFLKALTDTLFDPEYFDLNDVWNLCSVCNFFKECFKNN